MTNSAENLPIPKFDSPAVGDSIPVGDRVYKIGAELGSGAFGKVYYCDDDWGNKLVAKILLPKGTYDDVKKNWHHELGNLLQLRHPNVTFLYNAFEHNHTFYLILERCVCSLEEWLGLENITPKFWLRPIARCILQAVDFFHTMGYVHKDLHIGNVFVSFINDEVDQGKSKATVFKVGDLGISKLIPEVDWFNTKLAQWMLPPEFLNTQEFGPLGPRVDIYHCGLLFLQILLKQKLSFTIEEILAGAPRELAESLGEPFGPVIGRSLRRHSLLRTQSAMQFWKEIDQASTIRAV